MVRYLQVIAAATHTMTNGSTMTVQIPTFYLDTGVQGIINGEQAQRIATKIINPFESTTIQVHCTISEIH